ncbi:MAG: nicotinate (nicotinamide) nucleotide adenylyltransferase [Elainellaceae cyanobacterium]
MTRLGIFGGTFNPVHWGHLLIAETARDQCMLDRVIWVPTHYPPYKSADRQVAFAHRLEMVNRAIASNPKFCLSAAEQDHTHASFAAETWAQLNSLYPNSHWHWIVGFDAFLSLPRWHRVNEFASQCHWLVAPRFLSDSLPSSFQLSKEDRVHHFLSNNRTEHPHFDSSIRDICQQIVQALSRQSVEIQWQLLQAPQVEISSTLVRQYWGDRRSIRYLVPESVRLYIEDHQLYQNFSEARSDDPQ